MLPVAEYPHEEPWPGAPKLKDGFGCSAQGLGVANYAGFEKAYLVGDWCSGRLYGVAWDKGASKWQLQELLHCTCSCKRWVSSLGSRLHLQLHKGPKLGLTI